MQEVRQQHEVVAATKVDVKGTAFNRGVPIPDAGFLGVFLRHLQHGFPIKRGDFRQLIIYGEADAEQAVTGGNCIIYGDTAPSPGVTFDFSHTEPIGACGLSAPASRTAPSVFR